MGVIQAAGQVPFWQEEVVPWWKKAPARLVGKRSIFCYFTTEALSTRASSFVFDGEPIVGMRPTVRNLNTFKRLRLLAIDLFKRAGYIRWSLRITARYGIGSERCASAWIPRPRCWIPIAKCTRLRGSTLW